MAITIPSTRISCDSNSQIQVSDILTAVNENNTAIGDVNTAVNNIVSVVNNNAKIKTRRAGNILYMTDNGTNP